jgi:glucose/mannose-6-phosphate isomerase
MDKPEEFKKTDPSGVYEALVLFPEQIKTTWLQAMSSNIASQNCKSVVVSGMGGSSNAAKMIQGIFENELKIPLVVYNDYGLPAWVNSETLFVANSYSGNTEETLSGIEAAKKVGAKIIGVATGGKLGEMISSGEIQGATISAGDINPTGFPKTGLGLSLGGLLGALAKAGVLPIKEEDLLLSLSELGEIKIKWRTQEIAQWLHGFTPVFFGARPLIGALNAGRNAMCEISRNFTQFYDFPEVNHVLIEALQKPDSTKYNKFFFFESNFYNPRVLTRFEVTKGILKEMNLSFKAHKFQGKTKLTQALEVAHYAAWVGFYLSMLDGVDPGPEPWIIKLKESLSQPVH